MRNEQAAQTRARAWSRYWRSGARHSCPNAFVDHYGTATQAFWRERFGSLSPNDHVLELGCGNGSLIRFLSGACATMPASITGVDLAELDPEWLAQLPEPARSRTRICMRTSAHALPLTDASTTLVCSQYALEYFASEDCWRELDRIMRDGAALAAVVHHRDSHLCRVAQAELADSDLLLARDGPLDRAEVVLPWMALPTDSTERGRRDTDPLAVAARQRFNESFRGLGERIAGAEFPDLLLEAAYRVKRILQAATSRGGAAAQQSLALLRADLSDNRLRVAELVDCALDRHGMDLWTQRLRRLNFNRIEVGEIVEQGHLFGWSLFAERGRQQGER
jgi:SAM-dependent methyltransferase